MADRPVVVITGANGFIGERLVAGFDRAGWDVRALVHRMPESPAPGATYAEWRLTETATPSLSGAALLVHAASVRYDDPAASRLNLEGSERLVTEARAAGVARLTFISSMSARDGAPSQYGKDKFEISGMFDGPSDLVVRPGLVLGDGGLFGRLRRFVTRRRIVPLVGGGRQRFQTVHVDDLVGRHGRGGLERELAGTLTIAEREPVEFRVLLAEVGATARCPSAVRPGPVRAGGGRDAGRSDASESGCPCRRTTSRGCAASRPLMSMVTSLGLGVDDPGLSSVAAGDRRGRLRCRSGTGSLSRGSVRSMSTVRS